MLVVVTFIYCAKHKWASIEPAAPRVAQANGGVADGFLGAAPSSACQRGDRYSRSHVKIRILSSSLLRRRGYAQRDINGRIDAHVNLRSATINAAGS